MEQFFRMASFVHLCICPFSSGVFFCHVACKCTDARFWAMPTSHLFEVTLAPDGTQLKSRRVPRLSRRYSLVKKKINTMAEPPPDVWTCTTCSYSENVDGAVCQMCQAARPRVSRSVLLVEKNSTHPAAVAARRGRPPSSASKARPTRSVAPVPPRESPSRGAKDAANRRIAAQLAQRTPVPVAEVVHSPVSSPDGPLAPPPAVARAGAGTEIGLRDDEDSSSGGKTPPRPSRDVGRKTTGLDASLANESVDDFGGGTDPEDDWGPTDGEVSKYCFVFSI